MAAALHASVREAWMLQHSATISGGVAQLGPPNDWSARGSTTIALLSPIRSNAAVKPFFLQRQLRCR